MPHSAAEKTGRLFCIGLPSPFFDDETKRILDVIRPGSVILFSRNIQTPAQIRKYIEDISTFLGYTPVIAIDQEGGTVSRLTQGFTTAPGPMAVSATGNSQYAFETGRILGQEMRTLGITWDMAPDVDINSIPRNPGIGIRSYGDTPERVITFAGAFIQGLHASGVCSCLKHFPGLGRVTADTHKTRPVVGYSRKELLAMELRPYIELKADAIMPSHAYYPALQTKDEPASLSREVVTDLARRQLGYSGLFISDDLEMGGTGFGAAGSPEQTAVAAVAAGIDFLSYCHTVSREEKAYKGLLAEAEKSESLQQRITESAERIEAFMQYAEKGILKENHIDAPQQLQTIGTPENTAEMQKITLAGITHKPAEDGISVLGYTADITAVYSIQLSRLTPADEESGSDEVPECARSFAKNLSRPLYTFPVDPDKNLVQKLTESVPKRGTILIFTEDALLHPAQEQLLETLCRTAKRTLTVALRNPYDAWLPGTGECLMTYGYTAISQKAVTDVIYGRQPACGIFPLTADLE